MPVGKTAPPPVHTTTPGPPDEIGDQRRMGKKKKAIKRRMRKKGKWHPARVVGEQILRTYLDESTLPQGLIRNNIKNKK